MKTFIVVLAFAVTAFAQGDGRQANPARDQQQRVRKMRNVRLNPVETENIKKEIESLNKAWNGGDIAGMSAYMAEEVEVISPIGLPIKGKKALDARHAEIMKRYFAGSQQTMKVQQVRFVRPRVAICDVEVTITKYKALPPGIPAKAGQPVRLLTRYILTHDSRDWTIDAFQSTVLRETSGK